MTCDSSALFVAENFDRSLPLSVTLATGTVHSVAAEWTVTSNGSQIEWVDYFGGGATRHNAVQARYIVLVQQSHPAQ